MKASQNSILGFTVIELIIVFAIMAVLSTVGFAAFVNYNHQQTLNNTVAEIKMLLQEARSRTGSQVNQATSCIRGQCSCTAGQQFGGYVALFCCKNGQQGAGAATTCPSCFPGDTTEHYELNLICGGSNVGVLDSQPLSSNIIFNTSSTSRSFMFQPLTGQVVGAGTITITGFNESRSITVSDLGVINDYAVGLTPTPSPTMAPTATPTIPPGSTPTPTPTTAPSCSPAYNTGYCPNYNGSKGNAQCYCYPVTVNAYPSTDGAGHIVSAHIVWNGANCNYCVYKIYYTDNGQSKSQSVSNGCRNYSSSSADIYGTNITGSIGVAPSGSSQTTWAAATCR
jgi:type II secretory pathway pseudopilin PulG